MPIDGIRGMVCLTLTMLWGMSRLPLVTLAITCLGVSTPCSPSSARLGHRRVARHRLHLLGLVRAVIASRHHRRLPAQP